MKNKLSARELWNGEVYFEIEVLLDVCTSDAQGMCMAKESVFDSAWADNKTPAQAAEIIVKFKSGDASVPSKDTPPAPVNPKQLLTSVVNVSAKQFVSHDNCIELSISRMNSFNWESFPNESDENCGLYQGTIINFGDWIVTYTLPNGRFLRSLVFSNSDYLSLYGAPAAT